MARELGHVQGPRGPVTVTLMAGPAGPAVQLTGSDGFVQIHRTDLPGLFDLYLRELLVEQRNGMHEGPPTRR